MCAEQLIVTILLGYEQKIKLGRSVAFTVGSTLLIFIIGWIIREIDKRGDTK